MSRAWGNPGLVAMSKIKSFKDLAEQQEKAMRSLAEGKCGCWHCIEERGEIPVHYIVCPVCGDKRCSKASDHRLDCDRIDCCGD